MLAQRASVAAGQQDDFYRSQLKTARFYFARLLPQTRALAESVQAGSETLMDLEEELF